MKQFPVISVVVPSFNQAAYLPETLQSIVEQQYPKLEVIIQDGGSTDGSIQIAEDFVQKYPKVFRFFVEKDGGQADALNRGFKKATGEIMAFLNSDDTYFPKVLHRVSQEIDPARGRFLIMGRCLFTGEGSRYCGVEHPAIYKGHFYHLAIWKRGYNTIPQPSVFWHRSVWDKCGGFDIQEQHALDYDLFCRFSKHYHFHFVDELFSTYRMHDLSKSAQKSENEVLELVVTVSKKYWGSWYEPLRWRCEVSYWFHNSQWFERAKHHARRAEGAYRSRNYMLAAYESGIAFVLHPRKGITRLFVPWIKSMLSKVFAKLFFSNPGHLEIYADGWIGPIHTGKIYVPKDGANLVVVFEHFARRGHRNVTVKLFINKELRGRLRIKKTGTYELKACVGKLNDQTIHYSIRTNSRFIPSRSGVVEDHRMLSLKIKSIEVVR